MAKNNVVKILQNRIHIVLPVVIIALVCAVLLFIAHTLTREKIQENARVYKLRLIESVIPLTYNNNLYDDFIVITDPSLSDKDRPVTVFRVRQDNKPVGVVFSPVLAKGYSGEIELIIGLAYDGTIMGVQVFRQHETEGMGDRIDPSKSDWVSNFTDHSLDNTPLETWTVTADGGQFDELSGATITSRGVVNAIRNTLEYYKLNRDKLYQTLINKLER